MQRQKNGALKYTIIILRKIIPMIVPKNEYIVYRAVAPDEFVIQDGKLVGFVKNENVRENSPVQNTAKKRIFFLNDAERKSVKNEIDCHSSDEYDCIIYEIYTLFRRNELKQEIKIESAE